MTMGDQFDRFSKSLSGGLSRRRFISKFAAGILGGAAALVGAKSSSTKASSGPLLINQPYGVNQVTGRAPTPIKRLIDHGWSRRLNQSIIIKR